MNSSMFLIKIEFNYSTKSPIIIFIIVNVTLKVMYNFLMFTLKNVNYFSAAVAAIVAWFFGALWYSPLLFWDIWSASNNVQDPLPYPILSMGVSLIGNFVVAVSIAVISNVLGICGFRNGFLLSLWIGIGILAVSMVSGYMFLDMTWQAMGVDVLFVYSKILIFCMFAAIWRTKEP